METPLPAALLATRVLVVGCGNVLRGDDAVGPLLIRDLLDRGLPPGVRCADAGTGGMDVAFQMRGVPRVILIDACASGSVPGAIFELPGEEVADLPPLAGLHLHAFRWDHALAFARWLLKEDYPRRITVYLVEAGSLELGAPLSPPVEAARGRLGDRIFAELSAELGAEAEARTGAGPGARPVLEPDARA